MPQVWIKRLRSTSKPAHVPHVLVVLPKPRDFQRFRLVQTIILCDILKSGDGRRQFGEANLFMSHVDATYFLWSPHDLNIRLSAPSMPGPASDEFSYVSNPQAFLAIALPIKLRVCPSNTPSLSQLLPASSSRKHLCRVRHNLSKRDRPISILVEDLKSGERDGYYFCQLLLMIPNYSFGLKQLSNTITPLWYPGEPALFKDTTSISCIYRRSNFSFISRLLLPANESSSLGKFFGSWHSLGDRSPLLPKRRNDDTEFFDFIRRCLAACHAGKKGHKRCGRQKASPLPRRLLQVTDSQFRLVENENSLGQYVALPYCWGTNPYARFMTLLSNIHEMKEGILWRRLPILFRNAITITRKLGIQFIWIDSLCIVQDDEGDESQFSILNRPQ